jgi:hypothetical protein
MVYERILAYEQHDVHGTKPYVRLVQYCGAACHGTVVDHFGPTRMQCDGICDRRAFKEAAE